MDSLHWLWLPVLLAAAAVVLASPGWRRGLSRRAAPFAGLVAAAVVAELALRQLSGGTILPLTAWVVTFFALWLALALLRRRRRSESERPPAEDSRSGEQVTDVPRARDPFRPRSRAAATGLRQLALSQVADGIAVMDLEGEIELVNPAWARMHGYRTDEVNGHHVSLFHTPEQMQSQVRPWMDQAREAGSREGESEHRRKDGSTFRTRTSLTLLREPAGEPAGFVAAARLLEAPSETASGDGAAARAEQEAETLRVLVANVAHDFNNLLMGVLGNANLAKRTLPPEAKEQEEIEEILAAGRRAAELSRLLQSYTGNAASAPELLPVNDVLTQMRTALEGLVRERSRLRFELGDEVEPVTVEKAQLRLLLNNLVANAADAAEGGEITVRTGWADLDRDDLDGMVLGAQRKPGRYVFVEVADDGQGIDEATRDKMFEPFHTTRSGRRGLGLAAVLCVVRSLRGALEAAGAPGEGARFRVYFQTPHRPRDEAAEAAAAPASAPGAPAADGGNGDLQSWRGSGTILVVDNEQIIRDLAASILETYGFSVLTADDGAPAVDLYRERRGDIRAVLLDMSMPVMDGEEALRLIRQFDPRAQVVLMTGHPADEVMESLADKPTGFLQKPFKPEQLVGTLRGILGS